MPGDAGWGVDPSPGRLVRYFDTANAGWGYTTKHYALVGVNRR